MWGPTPWAFGEIPMSKKNKRANHVLAAKLGIPYQAADNIRKAGRRHGPSGTRQVIKTFRVGNASRTDATTFSARCNGCRRWIWCGKEEHDGSCVCGQPFRVVFGDEDWRLVQQVTLFGGWRCMDCGAEFKLRTRPVPGSASASFDYSHISPEHRQHDPWHATNEAQQQCNRCFLSEKDGPSSAVVTRKIPFRIGGETADHFPPVGIRRLTREEFAEATVEADLFVVKRFGDTTSNVLGLREALDAPEDLGIIARAFRDAEDPSMPAFPSAEWIGQHLTSEEVKAFAGFYFETIRGL